MAIADFKVFPQDPTVLNDVNISDISRQAIFPVDVSAAESGFQQRNAIWSRPLWRYEVSSTGLPDAVRTILRNFMLAHQIAHRAFRFRDYKWYSETGAGFGSGDASEDTFNLKLHFTYSGVDFQHNASMIDPGSEAIYIDAALQTSGADYNLDDETGVVTFTSPPAGGTVLTADFDFMRKCIFMPSPGYASVHTTHVASDHRYTIQEIV